jgi:hypothetical protein
VTSTLEVATLDKSLLTSLILAAITGLTILAYKHPKAYSRLYLPLFAVFFAAFLSIVSWNSGISVLLTKVLELIPEAQQGAIKAIAEELSIPTFLLMGTQFAVVFFMVFLLWLPRLIADDKKEHPPEEK